jgi:hypothetical protein
MKKTDKKKMQNIEHRGNAQNVTKNFQMEIKLLNRIPEVSYSPDGEVK